MRVLLVRHAAAEDRVAWARGGRPDEERPLTAGGRRAMRQVARGVVRLVPEIAALWTSPARRAVETAVLLADRWSGAPRILPALAPGGGTEAVERHLRVARRSGVQVLVGHEPCLGALLGRWLASAEDAPGFRLKKGGAALVEFSASPSPGAARLVWFLPARMLRPRRG